MKIRMVLMPGINETVIVVSYLLSTARNGWRSRRRDLRTNRRLRTNIQDTACRGLITTEAMQRQWAQRRNSRTYRAFYEIGKAKGEKPLTDNDSVTEDLNVVSLGGLRKKRPSRRGDSFSDEIQHALK